MRWRPLARRRLMTLRPLAVAMRARNPWVRCRLVELGLRSPFFIVASVVGRRWRRVAVIGSNLARRWRPRSRQRRASVAENPPAENKGPQRAHVLEIAKLSPLVRATGVPGGGSSLARTRLFVTVWCSDPPRGGRATRKCADRLASTPSAHRRGGRRDVHRSFAIAKARAWDASRSQAIASRSLRSHSMKHLGYTMFSKFVASLPTWAHGARPAWRAATRLLRDYTFNSILLQQAVRDLGRGRPWGDRAPHANRPWRCAVSHQTASGPCRQPTCRAILSRTLTALAALRWVAVGLGSHSPANPARSLSMPTLRRGHPCLCRLRLAQAGRFPDCGSTRVRSGHARDSADA